MRVDFTYRIDGNVLFIEDLNLGRMSVTNGVEDVLESISNTLERNLHDFRIMYRDSEDIIDGIETNEDGTFKKFFHIGESDYHVAKLKL